MGRVCFVTRAFAKAKQDPEPPEGRFEERMMGEGETEGEGPVDHIAA